TGPAQGTMAARFPTLKTMDTATHLLLHHLRDLQSPTLWLADEQIDRTVIAAAPVRTDLFVLGNRCDVIAAMQARGIAATLSDYDLAAAPAFAQAAFRVAKEKALVHHVINAALEKLPVGGALALSGYKGDGTKTYIEKAAARAGGETHIERDGGALLGIVTRGDALGEPLDDQDYAVPRLLTLAEDFVVWSKPGIFGWKKIDEGTAFLCEHLSHVWLQPPQRVLDLGCGYGYLTIRAASAWPSATFVAIDNNIAATQICARNMAERNIVGRAACCDCGDTLNESFDAILCNPPFHQGFAHEDALTEKFLRQTQRLLQRGGRALFVVNQFIGIEKIAESLFRSVAVIARTRSFKLVVLER
ncbi:MAG TPA: methyltransferase, partial [Spongiibacteraceae bacterium]|nr:methyltransferase [Spongiibacteraceae bacterium]